MAPVIRPLNEHLQKEAKENLFETPEKIQENLDASKEWFKKSSLARISTDDQFIIAFLRGCKHDVEKSKKKFLDFYFLRCQIPKLISDYDPMNEKVRDIIKCGGFLPLPVADPGSPRIIVCRPGAYNAKIFTFEEYMKVNLMLMELLAITDDNFVVAGEIRFIDLTHFTFAHYAQIKPSLVKNMSMFFKKGSPFRQKGVFLMNVPKEFEEFFNFMIRLAKGKLRERISVHSGWSALHMVAPRTIIPVEYGGEGESIQSIADSLAEIFLANRELFLENAKNMEKIRSSTNYPKPVFQSLRNSQALVNFKFNSINMTS